MVETAKIDESAVLDAIPMGRRAYIQAAKHFEDRSIEFDPWDKPNSASLTMSGVMRALDTLADAHRAEQLIPPLPEYLGSLITEMSDEARQHAEALEPGNENQRAFYEMRFLEQKYAAPSELAVRAALDHGFNPGYVPAHNHIPH